MLKIDSRLAARQPAYELDTEDAELPSSHIFAALPCMIQPIRRSPAGLVASRAMVVLNCRQVLFGALYMALNADVEAEASHASISDEIQRSSDGLAVSLDQDQWDALIPSTFASRIDMLVRVAANYDRNKHRKSVRGPKRSSPPKTKYRNGHHLSVKKIIDKRKQ